MYAISQSLQNRVAKLRRQRAALERDQRVDEDDEAQQAVMDALSEYYVDEAEELDELERDLEEVNLAEVVPSVTDEGSYLLEQEIKELESFVDELADITQDPKINQLKRDLTELDRAGHSRVIIFTQYADTMDFIRDSLISIHGETVATYSGRGGEMYDRDSRTWLQVGKERVKREFAEAAGDVDILVCTDSASEGLNLQECGALINYDLPWNPMRVEQRIGRIDRIGQEFDEITILNYSYEDTVETDIYDRLDDRIGLFETVVGEMQPILSGVSNQIRAATLEADHASSAEAVAQADEALSEKMTEQQNRDRIDVGESLGTVDESLEQDVVEEAKLTAWQSYRHPDITDVGAEEYKHPIPFVRRGIESFLTQSETLEDQGISFTQVSALELEQGALRELHEQGFEHDIYRLRYGGFSVPEDGTAGTVADIIAPRDDTVAVTFSTACVDEYPSLHLLSPGSPLLTELLQTLQQTSEGATRLSKQVVSRGASDERPLVGGWGRDGTLMTVETDGSSAPGLPVDDLSPWRRQFLTTRHQGDAASQQGKSLTTDHSGGEVDDDW